MSHAVSNLAELLHSMSPVLNRGVYVFVALPSGDVPDRIEPIASFREREGLTLIVEEQQAKDAGLAVLFRAAWITLSVHSDLHAVGLTAAVATALAEAGISCNVVAAAHHGHLFVPVESASQALAALRALQESAGAA
ncbi:ACT domain-containing protein [Rhodanobacter thiooxydans]|uniref:ACT domain-containing protein n=1 Tax=Rhodanobacter thiooxydans TaxID=416169 RepID=UPI000D36A4CB|nr:ACT domain-containing protein [Rhodanobacter thiooxydans]